MNKKRHLIVCIVLAWASNAFSFSGNYCGLLYFDEDLLDEFSKKSLIDRYDCRAGGKPARTDLTKVIVKLKQPSSDTGSSVFLMARGRGLFYYLPPYIRHTTSGRSFHLDSQRLVDAYNSSFLLQAQAAFLLKDLGIISPRLRCKTRRLHKDRYVICTITYVDKSHSAQWAETHFVFEGANGVNAWYSSPLLSTHSSVDKDLLATITALFKSMSTRPYFSKPLP